MRLGWQLHLDQVERAAAPRQALGALLGRQAGASYLRRD